MTKDYAKALPITWIHCTQHYTMWGQTMMMKFRENIATFVTLRTWTFCGKGASILLLLRKFKYILESFIVTIKRFRVRPILRNMIDQNKIQS